MLKRKLDDVLFKEVDASGEAVGEADGLLIHYSTISAAALGTTMRQ